MLLHLGFPRRGVTILVIVLAWAVGVVPAEAQREWVHETIDAPRWYRGDGFGFAKDLSDNLHLAYGGDQLVHAWHDGSDWLFEVVDPTAGCGGAASMAIGGDGSMHIAYSGADGALWYAREFAGAWSTWELDGSVDCHRLDIALDLANEPHIAYIDDADNQLYLMVDNGNGAWGRETLFFAAFSSPAPAIAVAGYSSRVLFEPWSSSGWEVAYVYWSSSANDWVSQLIDSGTGGLYGCDIVLDSSNHPRVAYAAGIIDSTTVRYATNFGAGWEVVTAAPDSGTTYSSTSIALAANGQPMITSREVDLGCALHRRGVLGGLPIWTHEYLDSGHSVGSKAKVLVAGSLPAVAYFSHDEAALRLGRRSSSGWDIETVDVQGDVAQPSIVVNSDDRIVHVSYGDLYDGSLRYAQRFAGTWFHTVLDRTATSRPISAIDLDSVADPHIAYTCRMNDGSHQLRWAIDQGGGFWEWFEVTTTGSTAGTPSMQLAGSSPRISYYDSANEDLGYASWSGTWQLTSVDTAPSTGEQTAVVLDSDSLPHIAYTSGNPAALKYAWMQCAPICWWTTETVDASVDVGSVSIALEPVLDQPRIAYRDDTNTALRYAAKFSGGWSHQTLDADGDVGEGCSIALEGGLPHISYVNATDGILKRAWETCEGSSCQWNFEVVDGSGHIGGGTAVAVDDLAQVHIAYGDVDHRDLLYALLPCDVAGDTDLDCELTVDDLVRILNTVFNQVSGGRPDVNQDGSVDAADVAAETTYLEAVRHG